MPSAIPADHIAIGKAVSPRSHVSAERVDAREYREQIIALFECNGNTQFAGRFDWYYRDRGQPTPITWLLLDSRGQIAGLCSVTLRDLQFGATALRAGIAGNLIIDRSLGAYLGPFALVNAMKSIVTEREIDILLGIPNELAQPVFSRLGFHSIDGWSTHVQISKSRELLNFYLGKSGKLISPLVDFGAAARRRFSQWRKKDDSHFRITTLSEQELQKVQFEEWPFLWHRFQNRATSEYLIWRFLREPFRQFSIAAIVAGNYQVCGYLVVCHSPGRIWIMDCGVDHRRLSEMVAILCFCRDHRARNCTVWIPTLRAGELSQQLSDSGFAKVPSSMGGYPDFSLVGYWRPDHPLASFFAQPSAWQLFSGFNDV
jgi:hypothetical protein